MNSSNWTRKLGERTGRRLGDHYVVERASGEGSPSEVVVGIVAGRSGPRLRCVSPGSHASGDVNWWLVPRSDRLKSGRPASGPVQPSLFPRDGGDDAGSERDAPDPAAVAAMLASAPVAVQSGGREVTVEVLESLAWAELREPWHSQLTVLGRRLGAGPEARSRLLGAIDRVAAECFELTTPELIDLESLLLAHE